MFKLTTAIIIQLSTTNLVLTFHHRTNMTPTTEHGLATHSDEQSSIAVVTNL